MIHRELKGVHQAALLLAFSAAGSVALGLLRDRLLAGRFGAGALLDTYFAAFRVPDIVYTLALFVVANTALIPVLLAADTRGSAAAKQYVDSICTLFLLFVAGLAGLAFLFMPVLAPLIAPGFDVARAAELIRFSRILLLSPLLLGLSSLVSAIVQSRRRFFVYAASPLFYNLGIIIGILGFYPYLGFFGLAWGVVFGALWHLAVQLPALRRLGRLPRPSRTLWSPDVRRTLLLSLPRTLGLSINQLTLAAMTAFASTIAAGSIAVFTLAQNLQSVSLSVVGLSYSVAVFPALAQTSVLHKREDFLRHVALAARHILFWSVAASALALVLRAHIVRIVLGAGAFGWLDTRLTAAALGLFVFSLFAQSLQLLFMRAFYAAGKTVAPVLMSAASAAMFLIIAYGGLRAFAAHSVFAARFTALLRVSGLEGAAVLVLPFAFSLAALVNLFLLVIWFRRSFGEIDNSLPAALGQVIPAGFVMGLAAYGMLRLSDAFFNLTTFAGIFGHALLAAAVGFLAGNALLYLFGNREQQELILAFKNKFWKARVIATEPERLP